MNPLKKQDKFEEKLNEQLSGMEFKPSDSLWDRIEQNLDTDGFEPALQNKLENYSVNPTEKVWTHIENQLPDARRKRGIIWFTMIVAVLGIGFGAGYWFNENHAIDNKLVENNSVPNKVEPTQLPLLHVKKEDSNRLKNLVTDKNATSANQKTKPAALLLENSPKNRVEKTATHTIKPQHNQHVFVQKSGIVLPQKKVKKWVQTDKKETQNTVLPIVHDKDLQKNQNVSNLVVRSANANASSPSNNEQAKADAPKPKSALISGNISSISPNAYGDGLKMKNDSAFAYSRENVINQNNYIPTHDSLSNFSITASAGMQLCLMKLELPVTNQAKFQQNYLLSKAIQSPQFDFNGGFLLNYHINQRWTISAGIHISSFSQYLNYSTKQPLDTHAYKPESGYQNGHDSIVSGSTYFLSNKYSFTEVPVLVAYKLRNGQKVDIELQAGISFAKLNLVNAYIPDTNCVGFLIANDASNKPYFKNVFFVSFAPSFGYKLKNNLMVGFMPSVKMSMSSIIDNENWVQQKPWFIGLNVFVRKRF